MRRIFDCAFCSIAWLDLLEQYAICPDRFYNYLSVFEPQFRYLDVPPRVEVSLSASATDSTDGRYYWQQQYWQKQYWQQQYWQQNTDSNNTDSNIHNIHLDTLERDSKDITAGRNLTVTRSAT
jgi:hypothetical protein